MDKNQNRVDEVIEKLEEKILSGNNGLYHDYCELLSAQRDNAENDWTLGFQQRIRKLEALIPEAVLGKQEA